MFCRPEPGLKPATDALSHDETDETRPETVGCQGADSSPLDSSCDFQQVPRKTKTKPGWGINPSRTEFGLTARRTLLRCGGAVDRMKVPRSRQVFLTGTLPGGGHEAYSAIARWSGYITNRVKTWVAHRFPSKLDMYVWELQKRGALHLHYFVVAPTDADAEFLIAGFKSKWIDILKDVSRLDGTNLFMSEKGIDWSDCPSKIQAYAQSVYASAAAYLAKYCSKQSSKHSTQQSPQYFPSRWWGVSRALLAAMKEGIVKFELNGLKASAAGRWYNRIIDKVEGKALTFYKYGERKGYQLFSVAYDSFMNSKSIMGDISCLRIFDTSLQRLQLSQLVERGILLICRATSSEKLLTSLKSQSSLYSGIQSLGLGNFPSMSVSTLVTMLVHLESSLSLFPAETKGMTGLNLSRWYNLIDPVIEMLSLHIQSTHSDWWIDTREGIELHCALTRGDLTQPNMDDL